MFSISLDSALTIPRSMSNDSVRFLAFNTQVSKLSNFLRDLFEKKNLIILL